MNLPLAQARASRDGARAPRIGGRLPSGLGSALAATAAALAAAALYNTYRTRQVERRAPARRTLRRGRRRPAALPRAGRGHPGRPDPRQRRHRRGLGPERRARPCRRAGAPRHRLRPSRLRLQRPAARHGVDRRGAGRPPCRAFARLGIERPVVVGHSWGTLVALALALADPAAVRGLVLVSGYYHPTAAGRRAAGRARGRTGPRRRAAPHGLAAVRRRDPAAADQGNVRAAAGAGAFPAGLPARHGGAAVADPRRSRRTAPAWHARWRRCGTAMASCACRW